jgi:hypothetical protein
MPRTAGELSDAVMLGLQLLFQVQPCCNSGAGFLSVFIARATRTSSGAVVRNAEINDDEKGYIVVDDQKPERAY